MTTIIRWGILGTGLIARKFAEGLKDVPHAELYAVGSRTQVNAENFAREYRVPVAHPSYEALAADTNVDVIYIATPHNLHCENTLLCLDHGRHVLCEKPFAVNSREVRLMIERARSKNLFLMEALWSRFLPNVIKAKEMIDSGVIGEVKFLECDFGINSPFNPEHRHYSRELIGGSLLDIGIYPVFLSLFLLGKPQSIKAVAGIGPTGVDHSCSIGFQYEKDLIAVLYSTIVAQTNVVAVIHGSKGKIIFDRWWFCPVPIYLEDGDGNRTQVPLDIKGNGYNYEAEEVGNCLRAGKQQSEKMSWEHSLELIDILDQIRQKCGINYPGHD